MFLFRKLSGRSGLSATRQDESDLSNRDEEDVSKQALDQASKYVSEGDYEEALWILERLGQLDPAVKGVAELTAVAEVCNAASLRTCACQREKRNPDWYKVLKVDEKSEPSAIKKRYRHLALLLHPDKNKHGKAEAAFKLVSEAYACLSDKTKREIFNVKKSFTNCKHCSLRESVSSGSDKWSGYDVLGEKTSLRRPGSSPDLTQTDWILDQERLRMFQARARARVFGNLEKAWKARGFTGLEKTTVVRKGFSKNPKDEANFRGCKIRTSETNQENDKTVTDHFAVVADRDLGTEETRRDAVEQKNVFHPQLFQPCKNLGLLIRDLQAEFISSTESKESQNGEQDVVTEKSSAEIDSRPDDRGSETLMQDGHGMLDAMSGTHIPTLRAVSCNLTANTGQKIFCAVGNHSSSTSAHGHMCPDDFLDKGSSAPKNEAPQPNNVASKQRFDKGFMCNLRKEHEFEEPEGVTGREYQPMQESEEKESTRSRRQDEDCVRTVSRKQFRCRQIRRDDSLDLEETILRTQREKSEQLLNTLQRLREETKTVAASLNHLRSGCS
ncbi:hypothetical protein GOP47_0020625 [Adiantum capillus-veneris]|uniref:J domain-containing protein n=1 Tax=Adiantum capillus-veneris TaxID=13818 RepID=A0A9D4Z7M1_ADICA|nr:hypothetical protein GOP47_0020625 [Adiantum capillus-veneris]